MIFGGKFYYALNATGERPQCHPRIVHQMSWSRHQMETFSALLAFVRGIHRSLRQTLASYAIKCIFSWRVLCLVFVYKEHQNWFKSSLFQAEIKSCQSIHPHCAIYNTHSDTITASILYCDIYCGQCHNRQHIPDPYNKWLHGKFVVYRYMWAVTREPIQQARYMH